MNKKFALPIITAAALAIAAVLGFAIGAGKSIGSNLAPPVQAAFVSSIFSGLSTTIGALIGAGFLVWQIGKQARNAIAANRTTEAIKLKKDVYLDFVRACQATTDAQLKVTSYIQRLELGLEGAQGAVAMGLPIARPAARDLLP